MSLNDSLRAFQSSRADAVTRNLAHSRPSASSTPARSSTPKPPIKREHDAAFPAPSTSAPVGAGAGAGAYGGGSEIMKTVIAAVDYLKSKDFAAIPFDSILSYLSLPVDLQGKHANIKVALQGHHRVQRLSAAESPNGKESYKYRPLHPVTNADELREYLARLSSNPDWQFTGLPVKELKDGWPDCLTQLDKLESEGHILISRNKKDNSPIRVYPDNPAWHITNPLTGSEQVGRVDADFIDFWTKTRLPASENDLRVELERAGLTPTSAVKEMNRGNMKKKERKRVDRKNTKKTNVHMQGILKDYSKLKPGMK